MITIWPLPNLFRCENFLWFKDVISEQRICVIPDKAESLHSSIRLI